MNISSVSVKLQSEECLKIWGMPKRREQSKSKQSNAGDYNIKLKPFKL
jgi:hypothetical protein